jgi:hypothetical protein
MEETDVCHPIAPQLALQQAIPNGCTAKLLPPSQRLYLGLHALAGTCSATDLAEDFGVSRKFVHQQRCHAAAGLQQAFDPAPQNAHVLFHLPVSKAWIRQLILALVLVGHCPLRAVVEILRDLFDYSISVGTVFNVLREALPAAQQHNDAQDLSSVRVGLHDEIFQAGRPVLVGIDAPSHYCYLLSPQEHRDQDTWALCLMELRERGFVPQYVVADAAHALRAAQQEVLPEVPCRSDLFHALQEFHSVVGRLECRAYQAMTTCVELELKKARSQRRKGRADVSCAQLLRNALPRQEDAIRLADDVALLARWLRFDVLALAGPDHAQRRALYDFILAELESRVPQARRDLGRLTTYLRRQRDNLLAFAGQLDRDFATLAARFEIAPSLVRELFEVQTLPADSERRWRLDGSLRSRLGGRYFALAQALGHVRRQTVRASSLVENFNGRLRSYFFLRRTVGGAYLDLLRFTFNHRRFARSEHPEHVGKSPAELLSGRPHGHWLEMLGFTRFARG